MTRIRWTTEAADQLEGIVKRIQEDNPEAARKLARAILNRIEELKHFPRLGHPGEEVEGSRERVARTCSVGPRFVPNRPRKAADLPNRSALRLLVSEVSSVAFGKYVYRSAAL